MYERIEEKMKEYGIIDSINTMQTDTYKLAPSTVYGQSACIMYQMINGSLMPVTYHHMTCETLAPLMNTVEFECKGPSDIGTFTCKHL